jgi:osmoprotectant transport system ATP-binding protein
MNESLAVELKNVSKTFPGGIRAVDNVSLRVTPGRIVALLGTSGCGKTTTLRLINRLEETTSGTVLVRGKDVRSQQPELLRRSIGYVIQEAGLFPHLNVTANVATVPGLLGWPRQRLHSRVGEVLEMVGLPQSQFGKRTPAELSGGQRQRVGVARALAADPDILLMDEPFGALDPGTRESIQDEFLRLQERLRKTVVLVTHDLAEAAKMAEMIVLMEQGRVIQQGPISELLLRPAGEGVRRFMGRQARAVALEALRLVDVVKEIKEVPVSANSLRLEARTGLGQALAALAQAGDTATVLVDGEPRRAYSARDLGARIVANLAAVGAPSQGNTGPRDSNS